jgi:hypothetical protein
MDHGETRIDCYEKQRILQLNRLNPPRPFGTHPLRPKSLMDGSLFHRRKIHLRLQGSQEIKLGQNNSGQIPTCLKWCAVPCEIEIPTINWGILIGNPEFIDSFLFSEYI